MATTRYSFLTKRTTRPPELVLNGLQTVLGEKFVVFLKESISGRRQAPPKTMEWLLRTIIDNFKYCPPPAGKNIDKEGISPDTEIKRSDEDYKSGNDPQLDFALTQLKK